MWPMTRADVCTNGAAWTNPFEELLQLQMISETGNCLKSISKNLYYDVLMVEQGFVCLIDSSDSLNQQFENKLLIRFIVPILTSMLTRFKKNLNYYVVFYQYYSFSVQ